MVDRYYRKINDVENDIENSIQISSILLKLKGYDKKLGNLSKIENNENNILSNLEKIDTNKTDTSSNLKKIDGSINAIKLINKNSQNNTTDISSNLGKITTNKEDIASNLEKIGENKEDIASNLEKIDENKENISSNFEKIDENKEDIASNLGKIDEYKEDIASNLGKIDENKEDILLLQNSNVKAFYNLDKIFIYDMEKGDQLVSKNNYYHMFEKVIIQEFIKDSYLEIILKVLTEISNYVLIGFFQILCNFHDENDDLFHTISLSTAMGGINKLSTIKSAFIVPINKAMNKIKIDFFIMPKKRTRK